MKIPIDLIQEALPDRYRLKEKLTEKSDRQTWLAHDEQDNQSVVLKILWFSGPSIWQNLKHFEREAQILQKIDHTAIPKFLDYFDLQVDDCHGFVLVQQYIPARSLNQHRDQGRVFSEIEIKQIIEQVLEILLYLHQQDPPIVHRDIKPSNLLLTDRSAHHVGQVYLVDFGASKVMTELIGKTLTVVGSYGYAPIEQFGGRAVPASDIYSLGATIVYLLTGRHPAELPQTDLIIQFETATNVSLNLKNWVNAATQPFLDRRFPNVEAAMERLQNPVVEPPRSTFYPHGTQITCQKFETFLQVKRPSSAHQTYPTSIGCVWTITTVAAIFLSIPSASFMFISLAQFGFSFSACMTVGWILFIVFVWPILAVAKHEKAVARKKYDASLFHCLPHLEYVITETEIKYLQYFLSESLPRIAYMHRSDLKQIDRILMHQKGGEVETESGTSIAWTDVPSYIQLRSNDITFTLDNLTEPEVDWLCKELSDYLGIPVVTHAIGD
jgi:hypothetical protein